MCKSMLTCVVCFIVDAILLIFLGIFLYVLFTTNNEFTRYFKIKTNDDCIYDCRLGVQLIDFFKRAFNAS